MSSVRMCAWVVLLTVMPALQVLACGPFFPISYFPYEVGWDVKHVQNKYDVKPHLGTELAIIGAHYYPSWTGKAPKSNRVSTTQADELDFFAAGSASGLSKASVAEDWQRFVAFRDGVCKRLEGGENVTVPTGVPDYAREFYLYKLGHAQWLVFRRDEDPAPFAELLALPRERRLYRTVWVHFVRIANARTFVEKDRHLEALRRALDDGFRDTAALESFTLRFLTKTCGDRYAPLVLTAYAQAPWSEWPGFARRLFLREHTKTVPEQSRLKALCVDPIGVEVAIAQGAGGCLPEGAVVPGKPALEADRQAWIAFHRGDVVLCRKLLAMAPERSLVRLFLEARLARLDGNFERAAERLHVWLEEYRRRGARGDDFLTGYGIEGCGDDYWSTGVSGEEDWYFSGTVSYVGKYGPSNSFYEGIFGYFNKSEPTRQSHEPTLSRVVSGELGVVMVLTRDLEEALYSFLRARNWIDIAFVAERCMTVDELIAFMRGSRIGPGDRDMLRGLLMRRLMRCGRTREASEWAPSVLKPLCDEFRALSSVAQDSKQDSDVRAVAFLNLSRLVLTRGMELMGTELRPDVAIFGGDYETDSFPIDEPSDLPKRLGMEKSASRWVGWKAPADRVSGRFHYRRKAIDYAKSAVKFAKDKDIRAWSLMFGGIAALSLDDAKEADGFYKPLAAMRHPRAKLGGSWFVGPVYTWFRSTYYNAERHVVPIRVPPRLTKEQLKQLKAPKD